MHFHLHSWVLHYLYGAATLRAHCFGSWNSPQFSVRFTASLCKVSWYVAPSKVVFTLYCDYASAAILNSVPETECYVLDGGSLLHRIPWMQGESYGDIVQKYTDFTVRHYGPGTMIVFDGYEEGPSIKDNTHQRRANNTPYPIVNFTAETEFSGKKEEFLSMDINKQRLIYMLSDGLKERNCSVINAPGDADVNIVKAAVDASRLNTTTLIGEDTISWCDWFRTFDSWDHIDSHY